MSIADKIAKERYAQHGEGTWSDIANRIARNAAKAEIDELNDKWSANFYDAINTLNFIPGGRILSNIGRPKPYMMNCNVLDVEDSRESIGQLLKDILVVSGTGGGVGNSYSKLRPKGYPIQTNGGFSSGPISFMHCADQVAGTIKTGGGRRAALMSSLSIYHPDIEEFLHVKLDMGKLNNMNISVEIDNKFIQAVKDNADWDLVWAGKILKTIKARSLWDKIVENALKSGEPGILNLGAIKELSNCEYYNPIVTTNPCGELPLPKNSACCLGSINIANFVKEKNLDKKGYEKAIETAVRFLDNIITINEYALDVIKLNATSDRRVGLGLTGLHYAMLKLGIKYSSPEGVAFTEKVYEILRNHSYWVSTELAKEKGAFTKFNVDLYLQSKFIKNLPTKIREKIRADGIRNVCLNTQAPTGTTSLVANVSSGIEPTFAPVYERRYESTDEKGNSVKETKIIADSLLDQYIAEGKDVSHFEGTYDVSPEWHLKIQEAAQRYIDSAVSKTINLPKDYKLSELSELLLKYIPSIKGVTIYKEGSRGDEPLKQLDINEYSKRDKDAEDISKEMDCPTGKCSI